MTFEEFMQLPGSKYAVCVFSIWEQYDELKITTQNPRHFNIDGVDFVTLSLNPEDSLFLHTVKPEAAYEFEFSNNPEKITFLTHTQVLAFARTYDPPVDDGTGV